MQIVMDVLLYVCVKILPVNSRQTKPLGMYAFSSCFGLLFIQKPNIYASEGCAIADNALCGVSVEKSLYLKHKVKDVAEKGI